MRWEENNIQELKKEYADLLVQDIRLCMISDKSPEIVREIEQLRNKQEKLLHNITQLEGNVEAV